MLNAGVGRGDPAPVGDEPTGISQQLQSAEARFLDGLDGAVKSGDRQLTLDCKLLGVESASDCSGWEVFQAPRRSSPPPEAVAFEKRFPSTSKEST